MTRLLWKEKIMLGLIGLGGCAVFAGCQEKPDGPQTIIIELSDPEDQWETESESISESETTQEAAEAEPTAEKSTAEELTEEETAVKEEQKIQLDGLDEEVCLEYTHIASDDPIISLIAAGMLPEGVELKDFTVTDVQAYLNGEEIIPAGEVTFSLPVEDGTQVVLYRLDEEGELVKETLEAVNGVVSYQSQGCGRWMVLDAGLEAETEAETEGVSAEDREE